MIWLSAEAPPATRPVPHERRQEPKHLAGFAAAHHVPGEGGDDDEEVEPRLGQRDKVCRAGAVDRDSQCFGARFHRARKVSVVSSLRP